MPTNGNKTFHDKDISVELSYLPSWWHSGSRLAALIFLLNALALMWLLLFGLMPRETLAWFVDGVYWIMALCLGTIKWPG